MCTIAFKTSGNQITDKIIKNLMDNNPDGTGIMWASNGKVHWEKGLLTYQQVLDIWHSIPIECNAAIHCRIATHGGVNDRLCHPFALCKGKFMYQQKGSIDCCVMHNGVMSFMEKTKYYTDKIDSDSSAFARACFESFGCKLPSQKNAEKIKEKTSGNRLLFLDGKGNYQLFGEWEYCDGVFYSNSNWKEKSYYNWGKSYYTGGVKTYSYHSHKGELDELIDEFGLIPANTLDICDDEGYTVSNYDKRNMYTDGYSVWEYKDGCMNELFGYCAYEDDYDDYLEQKYLNYEKEAV